MAVGEWSEAAIWPESSTTAPRGGTQGEELPIQTPPEGAPPSLASVVGVRNTLYKRCRSLVVVPITEEVRLGPPSVLL